MRKYRYFLLPYPVQERELNKEEFFEKEFISMTDTFKKYVFSQIGQVIKPPSYNIIPLVPNNRILSDIEIIKDLGKGEIVSPHQWAEEFCSPVENQSNGQYGPLLTNGFSNVRYVRTSNFNTFAVHIRFLKGSRSYWCFDALTITSDGRWSSWCKFFVKGQISTYP